MPRTGSITFCFMLCFPENPLFIILYFMGNLFMCGFSYLRSIPHKFWILASALIVIIS